ncbi:FAD-dependent oxidoreductase [Erysipelothrix inopinata]|uniref:FAD-dependent oxidoreductase n=1 Tax=Erysipelothrix inopinata TaxID=225084 RepID=A0A7G9RW84_9FIRM|nr:FAD-dependent oxidoreductase [Erysipelothrix inopinata]QNN59859.1 FAD-dependent oxidoreductase [Erysipelothrix inopinata]
MGNNPKRVVVVGGVAGGMSFATRYRRLNQNDHIIVIEKGPYVSFANCGLPYYVSGEIENRSDLIVAQQSMLQDRFQLDIRVNSEVVAIHSDRKTVSVKWEDKVEEVSYDSLILSPGAKPVELDIEGKNNREGIFTLRNIPDVDKIVEYIDEKQPKSAVVIGAGFIGLEMAENLKLRGLTVSVVEKAPHVLPPFDEEMAKFAERELNRNDVRVYTGTSVVRFDGDVAYLEDGTKINANIVIMSVGVVPETKMAQEAGIEVGMRQGIKVDEKYQTSIEDIYAVGDAIIVKNVQTGEDTMIPLASPANRQGRQLADILSGKNKKNKGSLGTAIVRIFDLTFASTGLNERQLKDKDYEVMHLHSNDHAGYFPGATPIDLKVIFDPKTELILGAQAVGKKGVDKRIDILATAIKAGYPVTELQELELTYAPPFGSAKDIVNMAGYVAENILDKTTDTIQWYELENYQNDGAIVVDVRYENERNQGYIEGSIHMVLDNLRCEMNSLPKDKEIIVYCHSAVRSYNAERILKEGGFNVKNLDGSYALYEVAQPERIVR